MVGGNTMLIFLKNKVKRGSNKKIKSNESFKEKEFQEAINEYNATESKEEVKPNYKEVIQCK